MRRSCIGERGDDLDRRTVPIVGPIPGTACQLVERRRPPGRDALEVRVAEHDVRGHIVVAGQSRTAMPSRPQRARVASCPQRVRDELEVGLAPHLGDIIGGAGVSSCSRNGAGDLRRRRRERRCSPRAEATRRGRCDAPPRRRRRACARGINPSCAPSTTTYGHSMPFTWCTVDTATPSSRGACLRLQACTEPRSNAAGSGSGVRRRRSACSDRPAAASGPLPERLSVASAAPSPMSSWMRKSSSSVARAVFDCRCRGP